MDTSHQNLGKVLGSTPSVTINVTAEIINSGVYKDSSHCMIAEAVKKMRPEFTHVSVDIQTIRATDRLKGERYIWLTPRKAQQHIIDYDQGLHPKPFRARLGQGQTVAVEKRYRSTAKISLEHPKSGKDNENVRGHVPGIIGGKQTPPIAIGKRRQFGLKAFV